MVSLSLGGSNSKKNLWPQSYLTSPWNTHTKDQIEYKLLTLVRAGKVETMHSNQKFAKIIAGRTISGMNQAAGMLTITFGDGSVMKIKTPPASANIAATGGKILKVRQGGTELNFDLEAGATVTIQLAEAMSSVMLRDKAGKLEYAD